MYKLKLPLFNPVQFLIKLKTDTIIYTAPCFLVVLSPSFWNAPNSTCSVTSAPIPVNTSRKIVRPPCHKWPKKNNKVIGLLVEIASRKAELIDKTPFYNLENEIFYK